MGVEDLLEVTVRVTTWTPAGVDCDCDMGIERRGRGGWNRKGSREGGLKQ